MKTACCFLTNLTAQCTFNQEKKIFKAAVKFLIRPGAVLVDLQQGSQNGGTVRRLQQICSASITPCARFIACRGAEKCCL
jgi:hypothetical protein